MNKSIALGAAAIASIFLASGLFVSRSGNGFLAPDTSAAIIINVKEKRVGATSAIISWFTNEPTAGKVYYSTITPVTFATATIATNDIIEECEGDKRSRFKQEVALTGLSPETTYYFIVESTDKNGNSSSTTEMSFLTKEERGNVSKPDEPEGFELNCRPIKIKVKPKPRL